MSSNTKVYEDKMKSSVEHLSRGNRNGDFGEIRSGKSGRGNGAFPDAEPV